MSASNLEKANSSHEGTDVARGKCEEKAVENSKYTEHTYTALSKIEFLQLKCFRRD